MLLGCCKMEMDPHLSWLRNQDVCSISIDFRHPALSPIPTQPKLGALIILKTPVPYTVHDVW